MACGIRPATLGRIADLFYAGVVPDSRPRLWPSLGQATRASRPDLIDLGMEFTHATAIDLFFDRRRIWS